jgi:hypothetical protein
MKKALVCLAPAFLLGCLPGINDAVLHMRPKPGHHEPAPDPQPDPEPKPKPGPQPRPEPDPRPGPESGPFALDSATVFLGDFDGNTVNSVTGTSGTLSSGAFTPALFGSGVHPSASGSGKYSVIYPNTPAFSLRSEIEGSLEALVRYDGVQPGFAHIVEKAWQYGITAYGGKLAADFGTTWWYSDVALPVGRWSYVAATFDGTKVKLYLNGDLAASAPYAGYKSYEYGTGYGLAIGNSSSSGFDLPFSGTVDAARVSRVVRGPEEIAAVWRTVAKRLP